eukprot:365897-Chlamydomonas_euryale.AAC.2
MSWSLLSAGRNSACTAPAWPRWGGGRRVQGLGLNGWRGFEARVPLGGTAHARRQWGGSRMCNAVAVEQFRAEGVESRADRFGRVGVEGCRVEGRPVRQGGGGRV